LDSPEKRVIVYKREKAAMDEVHKQRIEAIIRGFECPKDFSCWKSGFQSLCRARRVASSVQPECLEEEPRQCKFALSFKEVHLCECPLRLYLIANLDI